MWKEDDEYDREWAEDWMKDNWDNDEFWEDVIDENWSDQGWEAFVDF